MIPLYLLVGLLIGLISGTLGIGGGVLLVPALTLLFRFEHSTAIGTTLGILVPPIGLLAAWNYYMKGKMDLEAATFIALAFVLGAYAGSLLVTEEWLPLRTLQFGFGMILIYIGVRFLLFTDSEAAIALYGLFAVTLAWLGYQGLHLLGRRHLRRPNLGEIIRSQQDQRGQGPDYSI